MTDIGDPAAWTLTTDMTVRMRALPAPARLSAANRIVRRGGRSLTTIVYARTTPVA